MSSLDRVSKYIPFTAETADYHLERLQRRQHRSERHYLKVPMLVQDDRERLMVVDGRNSSRATSNASVTFPFFRYRYLEPGVGFEEMTKEYLERSLFTEIESEAPNIVISPLGFYLEYDSDLRGRRTRITQLPAFVELNTKGSTTTLAQDYERLHGTVSWQSVDEAYAGFGGVLETSPDNKLAQDSIDLLSEFIVASSMKENL